VPGLHPLRDGDDLGLLETGVLPVGEPLIDVIDVIGV